MRRCCTNNSYAWIQPVAKPVVDSFIKKVKTAFIPPSKVLLAQVDDSDACPFLTGVSGLGVSPSVSLSIETGLVAWLRKEVQAGLYRRGELCLG